MRHPKIRQVLCRVEVGNRGEVSVRFRPPVFRSIARLSDCAADEYLPHSLLVPVLHDCYSIGRNRDFNTRDIQGRRRESRIGVYRIPQIEFVRCSLEGFDDVDTALRIIADQGAIAPIIPALFQFRYGAGHNAINAAAISQAICDCSSRMLILNDQRSIGAGIFRLPKNPQLPYGRRCHKIVGELRSRKPRSSAWGWRTGHG